MKLVRLDSNPHRKETEVPDDHVEDSFAIVDVPDAYPVDESSRVRVPFRRFGRGAERQSDFAVDIDWLDVKSIIRTFIEIGHPHALHLKRVLELASAIERAGADQPAEFWDHLLQRD